MTINDTTPTVSRRAAVIKKAITELRKIQVKRQVTDVLAIRNGPIITLIYTLALNSSVLVWREGNTGQNGSWEGPYKLISMDGENCVLDLPYGPTTFRSTAVKPFLSLPSQTDDVIIQPVTVLTTKSQPSKLSPDL